MLTINALTRAYGTPIRAFIEALMMHFDVYLKIVQDHMKVFLDRHVSKTTTPTVRHVANGFALKYAVGQLPIAREITDWPEDEAERSIVFVWELWIRSLGRGAMSSLDASMMKCRDYLKAHPELLRAEPLNGEKVLTIPRLEFEQHATGGVSSMPVLHWLKANNFLLHDEGRLTKNIQVEGETVNRYVILAPFLKG